MEKDFWRRITRDEIITDYNTKAVNVDAYQRRDNNSDTVGKGYKRNPTIDEQFNSKALLCSILSVIDKVLLVICDWQFSFSQRTSQVEPSPLLLDTFSKSSALPRQNRQHTASWSFSRSFSPATTDFQKSPLSGFYTARDLSRLRRSLGLFSA